MSVVARDGTKRMLPRTGADAIWQALCDGYLDTGTDLERARRWRYLAMLALREHAGWPMACIGRAMGHPKGHVTRCLARIKSEIRERFELEPQMQPAEPHGDDQG